MSPEWTRQKAEAYLERSVLWLVQRGVRHAQSEKEAKALMNALSPPLTSKDAR